MAGKLYVIGVGPGDPELLTLKAVRILKETGVICVPKGREEGSSLALSIVKKALDLNNKEIIEAHFPMKKTKERRHESELHSKWQETVEIVISKLKKGVDVAFITLGDPAIYSTFFYLYDRLVESLPGLNIEIVPGVSSINASTARANISLGLADDKIAILPANYAEDLKEVISRFDTTVLMKVHGVFDRVLNTLNELKLADKAVFVSKASMAGENVIRDVRKVKSVDLDYFSVIVVRK